jgi:hypothetical protein
MKQRSAMQQNESGRQKVKSTLGLVSCVLKHIIIKAQMKQKYKGKR